MTKYFKLFLFLCLTNLSLAQSTSDANQFIKLDLGRSFAGSGDLTGLQYGVRYQKNIKNQTFWTVGIESTIHDKESIDYFFTNENGEELTGKSRYITSGVQLLSTIGYDFLKNEKHDFSIALGPVIRYQTNSLPHRVDILYPVLTNLPEPIKIETFVEKMRTIALGGVIKLNYHYAFSNNVLIGLTGGFQIDTNADTIQYLMVGIGKKF